MKTTITFGIFLFVITLFSCQSNSKALADETYAESTEQDTGSVHEISVQDLKSTLGSSSDIVLLDVRTPVEIEQGTIPGEKKFVEYGGENFETLLESLDKSKTYYVYCAAGKRSMATATAMKNAGFGSVYNITGGITAWKAEGYDIDVPEGN